MTTQLKNDLLKIAKEVNPIRTKDKRWPIALGYCCARRRRELKIRPEILASAIGVELADLAQFEIGRICLPDHLEAIATQIGYADAEAYLRDANKLTPEPGSASENKPGNGKAPH